MPTIVGDLGGASHLSWIVTAYGYMAPEVLRREAVSPLSDLYSLGALAYRLLAGPPEPRLRRLADVRPGQPAGVAEAVDRALEHDPDARQSSVAEFRAQIRPADRPAARLPRREAA